VALVQKTLDSRFRGNDNLGTLTMLDTANDVHAYCLTVLA